MSVAMTIQGPKLPTAVGPLSMAVLDAIVGSPSSRQPNLVDAPIGEADPYGLDLHLALYVCYELHYRGFESVDARWEWNGDLLHLRAGLEEVFEKALLRDVGPVDGSDSAKAEMDGLAVEPTDGAGPSYFLRDHGSWEQMREYFVHRSLYHLKEGDPHAWLIPRLSGHAKAAFVAIEFDEFGAGRGDRLHQRLFADLLSAADLDAGNLAYLDHVPAESLVVVNLMSMFGLHRLWRGAAVGHFASTEITSPPGSQRIVAALERLGAPAPCVRFYAEHVEADAVHEQIVRTDVVGKLVEGEPHLDHDVVFGIRALDLVEERLAEHMMTCWADERTSLRRAVG